MPEPVISVILPAYNAGAHIDLAIASIREQTYSNFELIVVNDGSSDDTLARIAAHAAADPRIRVVSRENRGLIATLNEALGLARANLVARMDADDIAYPDRLARQLEAFQSTPGLCLCGTAADTLFRGRLFPGRPADILADGSPRVLSIFYTILLHPTLMIDRRIAGDELTYDPAYPYAEDFDLIRRLAARYPVTYLRTPLLAYRQHEGSVSYLHRDRMRRTHMQIAAENLRADGFEGDIDALEAFSIDINAETAMRAGKLMADVRTQFATRRADLRASYEFGWEVLFFLLHTMFIDAGKTRLLHTFMDTTDSWSRIRRRERMLLKLTYTVPSLAVRGLKASYALQNLLCMLASKPVPTARTLMSAAK